MHKLLDPDRRARSELRKTTGCIPIEPQHSGNLKEFSVHSASLLDEVVPYVHRPVDEQEGAHCFL